AGSVAGLRTTPAFGQYSLEQCKPPAMEPAACAGGDVIEVFPTSPLIGGYVENGSLSKASFAISTLSPHVCATATPGCARTARTDAEKSKNRTAPMMRVLGAIAPTSFDHVRSVGSPGRAVFWTGRSLRPSDDHRQPRRPTRREFTRQLWSSQLRARKDKKPVHPPWPDRNDLGSSLIVAAM